jgi:cytochrome c556
MSNPVTAHTFLRSIYLKYPELFPADMSVDNYQLKGKSRVSKKLGIQQRRILIGDTIYRLRPSFVMPYMRCKTSEAEKGLFLVRLGVPFWGIAHLLGRNPMFWYRCFLSLSSFNLVGTTVYDQSKMPEHLLCDEFHARLGGKKVYIATTVAKDCILGAQSSKQAGEVALKKAYGVFKAEVQETLKQYTPLDINTDGWTATQNALKGLFEQSALIECYLHAFIKIRDRATKKLEVYRQKVMDRVWDIYRANSKKQMGQKIRRLKEWVRQNIPDSPFKENILKLCQKKKKWFVHFDYPEAYRTSAHLDRVMKNMEKHANQSQMFRGDMEANTKNFRAFALLYNFAPSCPKVTKVHGQLTSPAARLNEFVYAKSWLENLLTAASLNGYKT